MINYFPKAEIKEIKEQPSTPCIELYISYENSGSSAAICKAQLGLITKQQHGCTAVTMEVRSPSVLQLNCNTETLTVHQAAHFSIINLLELLFMSVTK